MQYHLFALFHLINKFKSGLDVAVVIYVLKEHFEGAYPDLGLRKHYDLRSEEDSGHW